MMNLLGCSKENFFLLMNIMNYKKLDNETDVFFYKGEKRKKIEKLRNLSKKNSPFNKLMSLNLK